MANLKSAIIPTVRGTRTHQAAVGARCLAATAAGGVLCLSFPSTGWWWAAFLAIAAHSWLLLGRSWRQGALIGLFFGWGFFLPVLHWSGIFVGPGPWIALATLQTLFLVAQSALAAGLSRDHSPKRGSRHTPQTQLGLIFLLAGSWVGQEYLRGHFPFGGFPWARLAFSQANSPLAPLAALGGMPLLSFSVAAIGAALAFALAGLRTPRRADLRVSAIVLSLGILAPHTVQTYTSDETASVAAIQGNVPAVGLDFNAQRRAVLDYHAQLTETAAAQIAQGRRPQPDIVLWPENSSDLDPFRNPDADQVIDRAVRTIAAPTLVGAVLQRPDGRLSNTSIVWTASGPGQQYIKKHPVPFGEYIPHRSFFRRFSSQVDLVRADFAPGSQTGVLPLGPTRAGVAICFEVAYDGIIRDNVTEGADILIIQTNNATFGRSAESVQQLAMSRLRAIEHGRALVHISTVGVSALIFPDGTIRQQSELLTSAILQADLPLVHKKTPASRWGGAVEVLLLLVGLAAAVAINRSRWRPSWESDRRLRVKFSR